MDNRGINIRSLGYVAQTKRNIKNGSAFDYLFPASAGTTTSINSNGDVKDILFAMKSIVKRTLRQTQPLSVYLNNQSKSTEDLLRNLFNFIYNYIDYKEDPAGYQDLREPARMWADKYGVCASYSIFISSVLTNLDIKHDFKVVALNGAQAYHHVYVIVPKNQKSTNQKTNYWTIDPVLDSFNTEAPRITKNEQVVGLSGVNIRVLAGLNNNQQMGMFKDDGHLMGSSYNRTPSTSKDNRQSPTYGLSPIQMPPLDGSTNPFEFIIKTAFEGTSKANIVKTLSIEKRLSGLNGEADPLAMLDTLDAKNIDKVLSSPELKEYAGKLDSITKNLNLDDAKKAYKNLTTTYNYIKTNRIDEQASKVATSPTPVKELFNSSTVKGLVASGAAAAGTALAVASSSLFITGGVAGAAACVASIVCGLVAAAIAAVIATVIYLFADNADEAFNNFGDWISGKPDKQYQWDDFEGWKFTTNVNEYGKSIRTWRARATGSESGSDRMQTPMDYFPILLSIYKNAPLVPGNQFIVNDNKVIVHNQYIKGMSAAYGEDFWKTWWWMKIRAYMCTPMLAEILYNEPYATYKISLMAMFQSKNVPINWGLVDLEYLNETRDALKLQLLIAKRDQITYDNIKNPNNTAITPNSPSVSGSIVWVGGQDNGNSVGFMTNQPNLGLKAGDQVLIVINEGDTSYTGLRTIKYMGTDDGQYKESLFTVNMPKNKAYTGTGNTNGVFQLQPKNEAKTAGMGGIIAIGAALLAGGLFLSSKSKK
jgi:hypothetical protein